MVDDQQNVESILKEYFKVDSLETSMTPVQGGDIHRSFSIELVSEKKLPSRLFAKINNGQGVDVLKTEFESLKSINQLIPNLYPTALTFHDSHEMGVLLMSFHRLSSLDQSSASEAGRALAKQHQVMADSFGWSQDNYIGYSTQKNKWMPKWVDFFRDCRLRPMLQKSKEKGLSNYSVSAVLRVIEQLDEHLSHKVVPSLVHGDLWSGNLGFDVGHSKPLFYDPAPYYGDREVDIAMTHLFGSQRNSFYQAYQEAWPLEQGYQFRQGVYNLYHALNHVALFGLSYESLVKDCLRQIE